MDAEPISIRAIVHHIEHLVLYSLILWQVVLGIWLITKYVIKNVKFTSKSNNNPIIINGGESQGDFQTKNVKKDLKAVEVDFKKDIFIDKKTDIESVKMDEVIKGEVKTQKDKLRKLRGR